MRLAEAFLEILVDEGVDRVFGNPGTTELTFVDALAKDGRLPYVLARTRDRSSRWPTAMREPPAGRRSSACTSRPAPRTARSGCSTRCARGLRWSWWPASRTHGTSSRTRCSPATSSGSRRPRPSGRSRRVAPTRCRRCCAAPSAPRSPRRRDRCSCRCRWTCTTRSCSGPSRSAPTLPPVQPVADYSGRPTLLWSAASPAVVAGDGVGRSEGVAELVRVAETLGAPVYHAPMNDCVDFPMDHPAYRGMLAPENDQHPSGARQARRGAARRRAGLRAAPLQRCVRGRARHPAGAGRRRPGPGRPQLPGRRSGWWATCGSCCGGLADEPRSESARRPSQPGNHCRARAATGPRRRTRCRSIPALAAATVAANLPPERSWWRRRSPRVCCCGSTFGWPSRAPSTTPSAVASDGEPGPPSGWRSGGRAAGWSPRSGTAARCSACRRCGPLRVSSVPVTFVVFANQEYRTLKQTLTRMRDGRVRALPRHGPRRTRGRLARARAGPGGARACVPPTSTSWPTWSRREAPTTGRCWWRCRPGASPTSPPSEVASPSHHEARSRARRPAHPARRGRSPR